MSLGCAGCWGDDRHPSRVLVGGARAGADGAMPAAGSAAVPASPDCFSPATAQVALLKLQVDLMEGN